jgi:uncharacterized protein
MFIRLIFRMQTVAGMFVALALSQAQAPMTDEQQKFLRDLSAAAIERTHHAVRYDRAYVRIPYPNGDVPGDTGVCTDEIIRAYRALGLDLQKEVHEDMLKHFELYPHGWHVSHPDTNIDHRRVPNLRFFFRASRDRSPSHQWCP